MAKRFDYEFASVSDLTVESTTDEKNGKRTVSAVIVNDEPIIPTERFWCSMFARFGFNKSFFKYFNYSEVFGRISEVEKQDRMRLCVERDTETGSARLLAVSNPKKPVVHYDDLLETLTRYNGEGIQYSDGIVESSHTPRAGNNPFQIGGDNFTQKFCLSSPVDGYGTPSIFLAMLREICSNGMIGYAKTFRSSLALGRDDDDVTHSLVRALEGFSNDEGYAALRQRFEAATTSWASTYEAMSLYKLLVKLLHRKQISRKSAPSISGESKPCLTDSSDTSGTPVITAFHNMTGDISQTYGLANIDALSVKRQRTLPVNCSTYDLLNFVSEVATHHADEQGARASQAWLGTLVSGEYDLEGSQTSFGEYQDFFLDRKLDGETAMELQNVAV